VVNEAISDIYLFCHRCAIIRANNSATVAALISVLNRAANLEEVSTDVKNHD
jgi:hypothetical protein